MLADINVNGRAIKAVALPHKIGWLYVFDRVTGQPVWPIEERPVEQSTVPGEKTSPTQPFPTKPPAYSRQFLKVPDDVIDFTPAARASASSARKISCRDIAIHSADPRQRKRAGWGRRRGHSDKLARLGVRSRVAHCLRTSIQSGSGSIAGCPTPGFLRHSLRRRDWR